MKIQRDLYLEGMYAALKVVETGREVGLDLENCIDLLADRIKQREKWDEASTS